jgi:hypothetical protein
MPWQNNKKIEAIFVHGPQNLNAWVHVTGLGWKLLWNQHDCQSEAMVIMAHYAKHDVRPVRFFEEDNKIKTLYVF